MFDNIREIKMCVNMTESRSVFNKSIRVTEDIHQLYVNMHSPYLGISDMNLLTYLFPSAHVETSLDDVTQFLSHHSRKCPFMPHFR